MGYPRAGAREFRCRRPCPTRCVISLRAFSAAREFVVPERARSFLRYLVEQTLAGHANRLKGYTIATAVFERDESFDAQADPVVRTEAGRLRRALERYYLVAGQADPVRDRGSEGRLRPDLLTPRRARAEVAGRRRTARRRPQQRPVSPGPPAGVPLRSSWRG